MNGELFENLIIKINKKLKNFCPLCQQSKGYDLRPGFLFNLLHEKNIDDFFSAEINMPTIPLVCNNCGCLMQVLLGFYVDDIEKFKEELKIDKPFDYDRVFKAKK